MEMFSTPLIVCALTLAAPRPAAPDSAALVAMLDTFLAGASRDDIAAHERFWADDLIYTGSSGRRVSKADILRDMRAAPAPKPDDPVTTYSAEDIRIQQYGNTAIVAFRLVGSTIERGQPRVASYLNSGTFLKRNGQWQVVNWHATRKPAAEDDAKRQVGAAEAALHRAMLAADTTTLAALLDESFVWIHHSGERVTRRRLLDDLGSGRLKYSKLETRDVTISLHGDAAVVRGVSTRQVSAIPDPAGPGDARPFDASYTLMLIERGGGWKAVAMHTSRP